MKTLRAFFHRLHNLFRKEELDRDLSDELASHLAMHIEDNLRAGISPEEARRAALLKLGGVEQVKQSYRERRGLPLLETLWQDLRSGLRMLRKNPGFTSVAVLTLALGIGANTAIFAAVNGILLHPVGIPHADRVMAVRVRYEALNIHSIFISGTDFRDIQNATDIFSTAALQIPADFNITLDSVPHRVVGSKVSWQWFSVFDAEPILGRIFLPEEDQPNASHEAVLSYGMWKSQFGSDQNIVGRTIALNQVPYRVVGVMGPDFQFPNPSDLWVPIGLPREEFGPDNRNNENYFTVAKLKPDVSFRQAAAYVQVLTNRVLQEPSSGFSKDSGWAMLAVPLAQFLYGDLRVPLLILLGAVGVVLLIACANVGGLLLARASSRVREFAVRTALGASPARLIRQTLAESGLLAVCGLLLGLFIGWLSLGLLRGFASASLSSAMPSGIDAYVFLFAAAVAAVSVLVIGVVPALQSSRIDPQNNLKSGRGTSASSPASRRFRNVLVSGQFAMALVLLVGAGLLLKSLARIQQVDVGFRPAAVMTGALTLPGNIYGTPEKQAAFFRNVLQRLSSLPGVASVAAGYPLPFSGSGETASFGIEGRQVPAGDPGFHGGIACVTPDYFAAMGIAVKQGRSFTEQDRIGSQAVVVIDENLARQYWPDGDAVGKRMRRNNGDPWATIVGVAAAVRRTRLVGAESDSEGVIGAGKGVYYYPLFQVGNPDVYGTGPATTFLVARPSGNVAALTAAIPAAVKEIDPAQPVFDLQTMEQRVAASLGPRRSAIALLSFFAALGVMLSAIGLFALVRYSVVQRTQEIGVRIALGATAADVRRMVLRQGVSLVVTGLVAGCFASFVLARVFKAELYEVSASDPLTYIAVAAGLVLTALLASWLPARRASRVDPTVALRYE
ncbi:MAG TPA: ABC transporter permease [Candidatus Acidoferrum sp.]